MLGQLVLDHPLDVLGACMGPAWGLHGACLGPPWGLHGASMEPAWGLLGSAGGLSGPYSGRPAFQSSMKSVKVLETGHSFEL